jgi:pyruvate kinase
VSKHHLHLPIYAITYRDATLRRAALYRAVVPLRHRFVSNSDRLLGEIERALVRGGRLSRGDRVAYLGGANPGGVATDFLQLRRVGTHGRPRRRAAPAS